MPTVVVYNGGNVSIPNAGEKGWGSLTNDLADLFQNVVNKSEVQSLSNKSFTDAVGIGTAAPAVPLHIQGDSATQQVRVEATDTSEVSLQLTNTTGSHKILVGVSGQLVIEDVTAGQQRLVIAADGNVIIPGAFAVSGAASFPGGINASLGIGTTSPTRDLHVYGNTTSTVAVRVQNAGTGAASVDLDNSEGSFRIIADANDLRFNDGGDDVLTIDGAGNKVGILQTTPLKELHIEGPGSPGFRIKEQGTSSASYIDYTHDSDDTARISMHSHGQTIFDINPTPADGTSQALVRIGRNTNTTGLSGFIINTGDGTSTENHRLANNSNSYVVANNGNFGVGQTGPSVKLDVGGTDAIRVPVGTSAQAPTGANGMIRGRFPTQAHS